MTDRLVTASRALAAASAPVLACVLTCALASTSARAADDDSRSAALTVDQAITEALAHDAALLGARAELGVAHERLAAAEQLLAHNPEIAASVGHRDFEEGGDSAAQPSVELSIELEVAGQRGRRIEAARHEMARVAAEIADAERLVRGRVSEAFARALHANERLALASEAERVSVRLRDASTARYERGETGLAEPNLAAIRSARARGEVLAAGRAASDALRALELAIGREPRAIVRLAGSLHPAASGSGAARGVRRPADGGLTPAEAEAWVEAALRNRPDVRAAAADVARVRAEQELARRLAVPNPTLGAFYEEEAEAGGARDRIVGAGVSVPLPLFDRRGAERAELDGRHAQAQLAARAKAQAVRGEVEDALAAYRSAAALVELYETDALGRITESLRLVESAYREGKIGSLELAVAQSDLLDARAAHLDALLEYRLARAALEQAVGEPLANEPLVDAASRRPDDPAAVVPSVESQEAHR